jgi:hypothetical protein
LARPRPAAGEPPTGTVWLAGSITLTAIAFFLLGLISDLLIPLVVLLVIGVVSLIAWSVIAGLLGRDREIMARVTAGLNEGGSLAAIGEPDTEQARRILGRLVETLVSGLSSVIPPIPTAW